METKSNARLDESFVKYIANFLRSMETHQLEIFIYSDSEFLSTDN